MQNTPFISASARRTEMSGGRASRQKGNRTERAIVRALQDAGFAAERVPLSGSMRGRFGGDVSVPLLGRDLRCEVKCRGNGFRQLYDWLDGADLLIVKADRLEPLAVLPLKFAAEIAAIAEHMKNFPQTQETPPDGSGKQESDMQCLIMKS
jgi:Holliday junction resolvase